MKNLRVADESTSSPVHPQNMHGSEPPNRNLPSPRKSFCQPPPEILFLIFERTMPPYFMLDSSASFCHGSLFCLVLRHKKSLVMVCRAWYNAGLPFLYENVTIRRVHQLARLLHTLVHPPPGLKVKDMIKTVDIYCHVPDWYARHFERQLQVLFFLCPRIVSCNFRSEVPQTTPLRAAVLHVTHLSLHEGIKPDTLEMVLQAVSPYIISLSFYVPRPDSQSTSAFMAKHGKYFPNLQAISIWLTAWIIPDLNTFTQSWKMPCLKHLTFHARVSRLDQFLIPLMENFCKSFGAGLQFLQVAVHWINPVPVDFESVIKFCPALEHIVLSPQKFQPFTHAGIKWIDIWAPGAVDVDSAVEELKCSIKAHASALPALKGMRILPFYLRDPHSYDLPLLVPPDMVRDSRDAFECRFLGVGVRHDVGEMTYIQPEWQIDDDEENEDDEDEEDEAGNSKCVPDDEWNSEDESESVSNYSESEPDGEADPDFPRNKGDQMDIHGLETDFPWLDDILRSGTTVV